ncbi:transporter substrate-binding domain-containing protein [Alteromonas sp. ASW11-130]|uniref:transporter substrate-binding domain-containing protein n=1 Tax=Alteromonas sp. ASW11-130 TaxID=3015775 RepID=UPI00224247D5|nr:transporter substrate-binding domain-containing protein [Alteromonas sp. ASW11-130]MCW8092169.1 transporter substrate-binding domain-containing protein [Alteromonas sp. ASW11-130]
MQKPYLIVLALICLSFNLSIIRPAKAENAPNNQLLIGTKIAPPFVMKNDNGELSGLSIELWEQMAAHLDTEYQFTEADLSTLLNGLNEEAFDMSIAAVTVTAEREQQIDFSHPYFTTGLAIAVKGSEGRLMAAISRFFSWEFLAALGGLCLLLFAVGTILWLFERRQNSEQFGGGASKGLGSSFWWAAVTMTTVGYGDKAPITLGGRIIGFIWMFAAIILISSFTAAIATSLTVSQLSGSVTGLEDLPRAKVTTVGNSASARFLDANKIGYKKADSLENALNALSEGKVDAVVYDKPMLQYLVKNNFSEDLYILPDTIERQDYAIALPENSAWRERVNNALLTVIESEKWNATVDKYLSTEE